LENFICKWYKLDMQNTVQKDIEKDLNEKEGQEFELSNISCFSQGSTHFALAVYRRKKKK